MNLSVDGKALGLYGESGSLLKRFASSSLFQPITSADAVTFFTYSDYTNKNYVDVSAHNKNVADS